MNQINKFERANNLRINVYSFKTIRQTNNRVGRNSGKLDSFSYLNNQVDCDDSVGADNQFETGFMEFNEGIMSDIVDNCEAGEKTGEDQFMYNFNYWFYVIFRSKIAPSENIRTINLLCFSEESMRYDDNLELDDHGGEVNIFDPLSKNFHYCYITNLSRLLGKQKSGRKNVHFVCESCLTFHSSKPSLENHLKNCITHDAVRVSAARPDSVIKFKNFKALDYIKFAIYADIECRSEDVLDTNSN